jgi:hypothetical protein
MIRCPNCGSEAIEDRVLGAVASASIGVKYIALAVATGGLFFVLVLVFFVGMGYVNRFVVSFVDYSPFVLNIVLATVITWIMANRIGRRWLGGAPVPPIIAPAPEGDGEDAATAAGPVQHHRMVCDHKWMKPAQHPAHAA